MNEHAEKLPSKDFESEQNLLGVFSILLAVDRRVNPQNYQTPNQETEPHAGHRDSLDTEAQDSKTRTS